MAMGRPRKESNDGSHIKDAVQLKRGIERYFSECLDTGALVSEAGLANALKISTRRLRMWFDGDEREELQEAVQFAYQRMAMEYMQLVQSGSRGVVPFVIFALKQPRFGGYTDKVEAKQDIDVNVKFGKGMDESDFK